MSDRIWHKGPPPHVGWWNASTDDNENVWRWWNGEYWSQASNERRPAEAAVGRAKYRTFCCQDAIEWSDYWPADARVPRLDPTDGHWTFNNGERPDVGGAVEVVFRNGSVSPGKWSVYAWGWRLDGHPCDIVAWRKAK